MSNNVPVFIPKPEKLTKANVTNLKKSPIRMEEGVYDDDDPTNEETMEDLGRRSTLADQVDLKTKLTKTLSKPSNYQSQADLRTLQTHLSKKTLNPQASMSRFNSVNPIDRDNIFKAEQVIITEH